MNTRTLPLALAVVVLIVAAAILAYVLSRPAPARAPGETPGAATGTSKSLKDTGQYYSATAEYPSTTPLRDSAGVAADANAVAAMTAWVNDTVATFKFDSGIDSLTPEDIAMFGLDQGRKYDLRITYEAHASPSIVSYVFLIYEDTLGAHPNAFMKTFTFDAKTGAELSIGDLFLPGSGYLDVLSQRSRAVLRTHIAATANIKESEVDSGMLESGTMPVAESFQWFYLEGGDLVLVFPPYSVGPWVIGTQTAALPLRDLAGYLKPEYAS